jgi:hypothetical protein
MAAPASPKPTFVGIFNLAAGVMGLIGGTILLLLGLLSGGVMSHLIEGDERVLALIPVVFFVPLSLLLLGSGLIAVFGGSAALKRHRWPLVVLGGIAATVCFFPLGIASLILAVLAEAEFSHG